MKILFAKKKEDYSTWLNIWNEWEGKEIFAHPGYLSLYGDNSEAVCAMTIHENRTILFPFLLRKIELGRDKRNLNADYYDIITPYGYGGLYFIGSGDFTLMKSDFRHQFNAWTLSHNVISEFVRFDLFSRSIDDYNGKITHNNDNVVCDLTMGKSQIWNGFNRKIKKNIRKALSYNVEIECDPHGDRLDSFLCLYYATMKRLNAQEKYFFKREYFEMIHKKLKGRYMYFFANQGGVDISVELVLISDKKIYSFLGGANPDFFHMRPNELLKSEIIKWGIDQNKNHYVLGGGYRFNDSLFSFKKDFAPNGILPYYIGEKIYNQEVYDAMVNLSEKEQLKRHGLLDRDSKYFPLYRIGGSSQII